MKTEPANFTAANVLLTPIVERERADVSARERILFRSLVEDLPAGIMIVQDGRIVFQNPAQKKLLGSKDHGDDFRNLGDVHPDNRPKFDRLCEAIASRIRSRQEMELRFVPQGEGTTGDPMIVIARPARSITVGTLHAGQYGRHHERQGPGADGHLREKLAFPR